MPYLEFKMPSKREENEGIVALVRLIKEKLLLGKRIECCALPLASGGHGTQAVRSITDLLSPAWRVNTAEPINLLSQRPGKADIPADMLMSGRNNYPLNGIAHVYSPEGLSLRSFLKGLHCQPCLLVWILTQKCSFSFFLPTLCAENNCRAHSPYALLSRSCLAMPSLLYPKEAWHFLSLSPSLSQATV